MTRIFSALTPIFVLPVCCSPRPTPEVVATVSEHPQAYDCMQANIHIPLPVARALTALSQPMGWTSEMVAQTYKVSRETQDDYAFISHSRANKARRARPHPPVAR